MKETFQSVDGACQTEKIVVSHAYAGTPKIEAFNVSSEAVRW